MEMALTVDPRPGRVPEQDLLNPSKLVGDGGGALYRIWENPSGVRVFLSGMISQASEAADGCPTGQGRVPAVGPRGGRGQGSPRPMWVPQGRPSGSGPYFFNKKSS